MNPSAYRPKLTALTAEHVDTIKAALRIAIRHDRTILHHDRHGMTTHVLRNAEARISAMQELADRLSASVPPTLPEA